MDSKQKNTLTEKICSNEISVIIPVYKAEKTLQELYERLVKTLEKITEDFELVLIEDCGGDSSWQIIKELASDDKRVKGIGLSRNFGQHHAITAGIDVADARWIVVMDCDLQDQPEEIIKLYDKAQEGYDCVLAQRLVRKDSWFKRMTSHYFYRVLKYLSDIDHDPTISNFGIYSYKAVDSVKQFRERFRSFGLYINLVGFKRTTLPIEHAYRTQGESTYTFSKRFNLAMESVVAFSNKPLVLSIKMGFTGACLSLVYILYLIYVFINTGVPVSGWTSMIASIYLIGSVLLLNMGFLGLYLGKIFDEVKKRPLYLIQDTANLHTFHANPDSSQQNSV